VCQLQSRCRLYGPFSPLGEKDRMRGKEWKSSFCCPSPSPGAEKTLTAACLRMKRSFLGPLSPCGQWQEVNAWLSLRGAPATKQSLQNTRRLMSEMSARRRPFGVRQPCWRFCCLKHGLGQSRGEAWLRPIKAGAQLPHSIPEGANTESASTTNEEEGRMNRAET
jgi:hypothetical protein